uniref:Protein KRI1 homolog n=1 Tax=Dicentrarchus labrax TaxID=13489 RepID=A0A8C4IQZ5_DICLA
MSDKSGLKINSQFAVKYEKYRQREELQRLKDRYGDRADESDSESSESSSDDSEVELDPEVERDFYRTLSLLKKRDPKIYQADVKFYSEGASTSDEKPSTSKKAVKPMYLKDYERKVILEKEGKYEDDDDSDDEEAAKRMERAASPSYIQEQKALKESFRKFIQDSDDDDNEVSKGGGESQLLTRRVKTQEEKDKEEADFVEWLKGQAELEGSEEVKDMKYLREYWNDPELDEKERFLRDYVLNKGYLDEDEHDERIPTYDEVVQDDVEDSEEEGETFLERQDNFERNYNFRFEEPGAQQIKTYPRSIATSVRSKDDSRKRKREEVKERKQKEKEQKREQLKQLKNLKRNEIMEKLKRLQELTGNEQLAFSQADLEGEFDPQQHEQLMQKFFGDEYYGEEEVEKPQFDDDDEELEGHWNWDTWTGEEQEDGLGEQYSGAEYDASEPHCDDEGFIMDADYDPNQQTASKKKKKKEKKKMKKEDIPQMGKKRKKSHFAEVITKSKPVFDPQEKSFEQYLDEYYKLDYEDIIDDLPCRFRYRPVLANDFGLTTEEILNANDKELNHWCSLKKTCMFRSDKEEMIKHNAHANQLYQAKNKVGKKRRDRLKNAENEGRGAEDGDVMDSAEETLAQALREAGDEAGEEKEEEILIPKKKMKQEEEPQAVVTVKSRTERPKWSKRKHKHAGGRLTSGTFGVKIGGREFSRQRLKAYGLNPKRLFFRQLGRQKRKAQEKKEKQKNKE